MKQHLIWMAAALALSVQTGASFADVMISTSNDPSAEFSASLGALMGAEKSTRDALSSAEIAALATGPQAATKRFGGQNKAGIAYTAEWLMSQPPVPKNLQTDAEFQCMKQALYFEARGETIKGQFAVAEVILNRVDNPGYPKTICGVVSQSARNICQFSYNCDGKPEVMHEAQAKEMAARIAAVMMQGAPRDITQGATHFHTKAVNPRWSRVFEQTASIGKHVFYRQ